MGKCFIIEAGCNETSGEWSRSRGRAIKNKLYSPLPPLPSLVLHAARTYLVNILQIKIAIKRPRVCANRESARSIYRAVILPPLGK